MMRIIPGIILAAVLAACGDAAPGHTGKPPAPHRVIGRAGRTCQDLPRQAADTALCNTFNTDMQTGDTFDIGQALQLAQGSVTPKLADDIGVVLNENGTVQQDLTNQILVTEDCAIAGVGIQSH